MSRWSSPDDGPDDYELIEALDRRALELAKAGKYDDATLMLSAARRLTWALDRLDSFVEAVNNARRNAARLMTFPDESHHD